MARIRTHSLSSSAVKAVVELVENTRDAQVREWGQCFLPGGFRKPAAIRARILSLVRSEAELEAWLQEFLRDTIAEVHTVAALSPPALDQMGAALRTVCGPCFCLALLLDPRVEVHSLGCKLDDDLGYSTNPIGEEMTREILALWTLEKLMPFCMSLDRAKSIPLESLPPIEPAPDPVTPLAAPEDPARIARLESLLKDEKKRGADALREARDQLNRARNTSSEHEQTLAVEKDELHRQIERLRAELGAAQRTMASSVEQRVHEEKTRLRTKWLAEAEEFDSRSPASGDLLDRAESALSAQAVRDRHAGNRRHLAQRLSALHQCRDRLQDALQTALRPLPELYPILRETESEIDRIRNLLNQTRPSDPAAARFAEQVNAAQAIDELSRLARLLDDLSGRHILPPPDVRKLFHALHRKQSLLFDSTLAPRAPLSSPANLRDLLAARANLHLVIDGHNVLFALEEAGVIASPEIEKELRDQLVETFRRCLTPHPNVQVRLIFDGPHSTTRTILPNLAIEFSGGSGEHRADDVICGHVLFLKQQQPGLHLFVVSNDKAVRQHALAQNARFVPVEEFAAILEDLASVG